MLYLESLDIPWKGGLYGCSLKSALAPDIESFIKMKRSLGYKYHNEEYILHRFDTYWKNENDPSDSVTMESLSGWVKQLPTEGKSSSIHGYTQ